MEHTGNGQSSNWPADAERELWADICTPGRHQDSLWWFLRIAWGAEFHLEKPGKRGGRWLTYRVHKPFIDWFQKQVDEWMEYKASGGDPERWHVMVIIPRDWGKSVTITKAANLWCHLADPNLVSYIGSEVHPKAKGFLGPVRRVMEGQDPDAWFTHLFGQWHDPEREWTIEQVTHAYRTALALTEPSFGTFGVDTGLTGYHPDMVFWDDPLSATKLRAGGDWLKIVRTAVNAAYPALKSNSFFCFILTPYLDDDVRGTLLSTEGIKSWDGMACTDGRLARDIGKGIWRVYYLQARDRNKTEKYWKGEPVLPEVDGDESLTRYEKRDPQGYASQKMCEPGTGEHMPITQEQIDQLWVNRDAPIPIKHATMHLDTAFKDEERKATGDDNALIVWLHDLRDNGVIYLDRVLASNEWRSEDVLTALVNTAVDLRRRGIRLAYLTDEKLPGGMDQVWGQAIQTAFARAGLRLPTIIFIPRQGRQKAMRITTAAGYWVEGFVRLYKGAPGVQKLIDQMLKPPPYGAKDDVADAASDVWHPDIWTRPQPVDGRAEDLGEVPSQPGDDVLKAGKTGSGELGELYAQQNPWAVRHLEEFEDPWGGRREPV